MAIQSQRLENGEHHGIMNYANKMMEILEKEFISIMESDPEYYSSFNIILSNEQQYVKNVDRSPKTIYIVVKFLSATITYGQTLLPVTINAIGEENGLEVCQRLLLEFAQTYTLSNEINMSDGKDEYIVKQIWQAPQIMSNFNIVEAGFRSLFYMSGTFLLGKNSLPITKISYFDDPASENGEDVDFITSSWQFNTQLDSQAFYGTDSRTISKSKIGTLILSLSFYLIDNGICKKITGIAFNDKEWAPDGIKSDFYLSLEFAGGKKIEKMRFSMASVNSMQNIGEFPLVSISLTN